MKQKTIKLPPPPPAYQAWVTGLGQTGWICQGTLVRRTLRRRIQGCWVNKGPYYMWTCKRAGKTVCQALSKEQYLVLRTVIAANRQVQRVLARMQALTLQTVLKKVPGVNRRKPL